MQQKEEREASTAAGESLAGLGCGSCFSSLIVRTEARAAGVGVGAARLRLLLQMTARTGQDHVVQMMGQNLLSVCGEGRVSRRPSSECVRMKRGRPGFAEIPALPVGGRMCWVRGGWQQGTGAGAWLTLQEDETEMGWSGLLLDVGVFLMPPWGQTAREWLLSGIGGTRT